MNTKLLNNLLQKCTIKNPNGDKHYYENGCLLSIKYINGDIMKINAKGTKEYFSEGSLTRREYADRGVEYFTRGSYTYYDEYYKAHVIDGLFESYKDFCTQMKYKKEDKEVDNYSKDDDEYPGDSDSDPDSDTDSDSDFKKTSKIINKPSKIIKKNKKNPKKVAEKKVTKKKSSFSGM